MTIPMSAIDRVKELLAAAELNHDPGMPALCDSSCGACAAQIELGDLAIPIAEELVASQEALERVQREAVSSPADHIRTTCCFCHEYEDFHDTVIDQTTKGWPQRPCPVEQARAVLAQLEEAL